MRRERIRGRLLILVGLLAIGLALTGYGTHVFREFELDTVDQRFAFRGAQEPTGKVATVLVDDNTFSELRERWPFPRRYHAEVIDRLKADGAKVIAYDVQFTESSGDSQSAIANDNALVGAIARARNAVLVTTEVGINGSTNILGGLPLHRVHARASNAILPSDNGGVIRKAPYEIDGLKSFAVVSAERFLGRRVAREPFRDGGAWIDFDGGPGSIPSMSFSRVYYGRFPKGFFRDKVVVVGAGAPSLQDVSTTSSSGHEFMPGPEIQASAVETVLRDFPLHSAPGWVNVLLIVLVGAVAPLCSLRFPPLRALALALLLGAIYLVGTQLAFDAGLILPVLYPVGAVVLAAMLCLAVDYITEAFERERVHDAFARFVPEQVVNEVVARSGHALRLGGMRLECTVLFSDLRGFTTFGETHSPDQVIEVLNRYLTQMSDAILDHGGTLVAYMGDGIMAVFGAPLAQPDHADRGLAAARDMLARLERFNVWLREQGMGEGFKMGIGLNTGQVMSGNVGSERRMEYSAIGDTVNTASRIESMTKGTPYQLFMADSTHDGLSVEHTDLRFVDELAVRGRRAPVRIWGLAYAPAVEPVRLHEVR